MDRDEATAAIADALHRIAPEADLGSVDPTTDLADELDLDSMDVLELYAALAERTGVDLGDPAMATGEEQAARSTLAGLVDALVGP